MLKYPGIIHKEEDGYWIEFPDLPGCATEGDTLEELIEMAEDALSLYLEEYIGNEKEIPKYSKLNSENVIYINVNPEVAIPLMIKMVRQEKKLSQSDIAEKMGIAYQTYQQIENLKKFNATVKTLKKVAKALGKKLIIDIV